MKTLKRISKKMTFGSLPYLDGRRRRHKAYIEPLPAGDDTQFDTTDDFEDKIIAALKDDKLGKRIAALIRDEHPYGTVPEMIMLNYLEERGDDYKYQAQLFGGYRSGGVVPDFLVRGNALFVQGSYWHNIPGRRQKDAADKLRVVGEYFDGQLINQATFIWEDDLMGSDRRRIMEDAILGIEHPR